jgi:hypothetical protein
VSATRPACPGMCRCDACGLREALELLETTTTRLSAVLEIVGIGGPFNTNEELLASQLVVDASNSISEFLHESRRYDERQPDAGEAAAVAQ